MSLGYLKYNVDIHFLYYYVLIVQTHWPSDDLYDLALTVNSPDVLNQFVSKANKVLMHKSNGKRAGNRLIKLAMDFVRFC